MHHRNFSGQIIGPDARISVSEFAKIFPNLGHKYPGGWDWLEAKLDEVRFRKANLWLSMVDDRIAALAIETMKGAHRTKLSTFVVAPEFRRKGIGGALLESLQTRWTDFGIDWVTVTIDETDHETHMFFEQNQFSPVDSVLIPYGSRCDGIMTWSPDSKRNGKA